MLIYSLSFLAGIIVFSLKNSIHISIAEWSILLLLILVAFIILNKFRLLAINIIIFLLGATWMGIYSNHIIKNRVIPAYLNKTITIQGNIIGLPKATKIKDNFIFSADKPFVAKLKLSWYGKRPLLKTQDKWQLVVKLKANNGNQNTAGFDYEKWLFYKQIGATGYVKLTDNNKLIAKSEDFSIDKLRQNIRDSLRPFLKNLEFKGVINALIIGDRSLISTDNWELFQATNTTHLSVISGLHIGLISGFVFLLASFLWRICAYGTMRIPAPIIGSYFGILSALLYALIAGLSIPTERALIMASVVFISIILRRSYNTWQLYGTALLLVLISNPVSIFSVGFWLSFYVVAVIIYTVKQHKNKPLILRLIYMQLAISIATIPLISWFFSEGSLLTPIANFVAIPVFSFITIPLSLISAFFVLIKMDYLATIGFEISNQSLIIISYFLNLLQSLSFNKWHYLQTSIIGLIIFISAVLIAILPRGLKLRKFSIPMLALLLFTPPPEIPKNSVLITIFDVGQGFASVIKTKNHTMLFDTGASFSSGSSIGQSIINPYLKYKQIKFLDKIIISHGDNDHVGGLKDILKQTATKTIITSNPSKINAPSTLCSNQKWQWDGILFQILHPLNKAKFKGNNASCVLKISNGKHSILFTGDIEKKAEKHLVKTKQEELISDIIISPHHGSKTSSTKEFLKAVAAKIIIISSGFQNRFNHPAKIVTDRYKNNNMKIINTSCSGQIDILLGDKISINQYRQDNKRYYMRSCN